jgi:hypothetical protein
MLIFRLTISRSFSSKRLGLIYSTAKEMSLVDRVKQNTTRYVSLFSQVIDTHMPAPSVNFREDQISTFEVIMNQRKFNFQQ